MNIIRRILCAARLQRWENKKILYSRYGDHDFCDECRHCHSRRVRRRFLTEAESKWIFGDQVQRNDRNAQTD